MDKVIRHLQSRLQAGSIIVLLSDFHDLQQAHLTHLHQLTQQHTVLAMHVLDDIEVQLPDKGCYQITDRDGLGNVLLNCNDTAYKDKIEQQLQLRQQQIQQWLVSSGIDYQRLLTSDEPFLLTTEKTHAVA